MGTLYSKHLSPGWYNRLYTFVPRVIKIEAAYRKKEIPKAIGESLALVPTGDPEF